MCPVKQNQPQITNLKDKKIERGYRELREWTRERYDILCTGVIDNAQDYEEKLSESG